MFAPYAKENDVCSTQGVSTPSHECTGHLENGYQVEISSAADFLKARQPKNQPQVQHSFQIRLMAQIEELAAALCAHYRGLLSALC
jgi:hypothetical protein